MAAKSTRHLVAPELDAVIDVFPPLDFTQGMAAMRSGFAPREEPPLPPELLAIECTERFIPGAPGDPDVRILHYTPPGTAGTPRPAILEIHGGGYVIGNADMSDAANRALADRLGCVVVSVDYRLAPETPWPGSLHDNYAALCWLAGHAAELGIDPARIALFGGSAGGGHAAALALHARNQGGPALCFQLIDYPMLDDRTCVDPEPHPYAGEFVWTPELNHFGWKSLLGTDPGSDDVHETAAPARAKDLSGLPATYISIGALDLFLDESLEYTRRLARAGVPVELHVIPGAFHGSGLMQEAPQSRLANELRLQALARALGVG
ncbi:MAG: alpha/beta hydrolase [Novosphingobium sp.]